ncbi:MAG: hypothetical protein JF887_00170 [Candidatus Dormibacteraeota bacterium]|uniref:Exo-alpha-sialidase n=1 Tax=Candidatus Amunia macphersoniae TaxID=3127014 RepID=A0A934NEW9_9BACT|nr:hypothetical protein [Candidatus Dormibacteraeota bacterium]
MTAPNPRLLVALTGLMVATATSLSTAPLARAASVPTVSLLRDNQSGTDDLTATMRAPGLNEYVQPDTQIEPSIAVDPANSQHVVAAYQEGRVDGGGDATNGFATSFDAGQTWVHGELPGLTSYPGQGGTFDRASDAVVTFGADPANPGKYLVYANSLVFDDTTGNALASGMAVNVSRDGGRTWTAPVILEQDKVGGLNDKNWIVVDNGTGAGHKTGRVYVVWDRVAPIVYAYCDHDCDQLANWTNSQINSQTKTVNGFYVLYPSQGIGSMPVIGNDGSLTVVFNTLSGVPVSVNPSEQPEISPNGTPIVQTTATKAGTVPFPAPLTFSQVPITIATYKTNGVAEQRAGGLPSAALDPITGTIYVGWEDNRFRTDAAKKQNDAVFSKSSDAAHATWSTPARINGGPTNDLVDHYNTSLAVGPDGTLHVMYRQRLEAGSGALPPTIDTYYQESQDGGASFTAPLKVDTGPGTYPGTMPDNAFYGAFSRGGTFQGDYDQIVAGGQYVYITRCESFPTSAGEPPALTGSGSGTLALTNKGHQHQRNFVAVLGPQPAVGAAESPWIPGLLLVGVGAGGFAALARRRRVLPAA